MREGNVEAPETIVAFWRDAGRERWFASDEAFDDLCRTRFLSSYREAAAGTLDAWSKTALGALALVILLDQIPRNIFRGMPTAWATDGEALAVAEDSVARGYDGQVDPDMTELFYLPFMHAENVAAQERSVVLYERLGHADALKYARHHRDIVVRFGRFPHRNAVLGRDSTPEELAFLEHDDFRG